MADGLDIFHVEIEDFEVRRPRRRPRIFRRRPNYFEEYREYEFRKRFRLSKGGVQDIVERIGMHIAPKTNSNHAITPAEKVLVTLRFYATGSFILVSADFMGVSESRSCQIIHEVTHHLAMLRPQFISMPQTPEEISTVQNKFYQVARFPKVIGSVDCTHVKLQSPGGGRNAELFRNRKGYFSKNVQVVCGPDLEILDIVTRWHGSSHDQVIFDASSIRDRHENGEFGPNYILSDSGYQCRNYILSPLPEPEHPRQFSPGERLYNESLIRTRNLSERSFGVLKRRFPILALGIRVQLNRVDPIIIACAVLHNLALRRQEGEHPPPPQEDIQIPEDVAEEGWQGNPGRGLGRPYVPIREYLVNNWFSNLE